MAAVQQADEEIRFMEDGDLAEVMRIEEAEYEFGWTEGVFRDCLRVGYIGLVFVVREEIAGYGVATARAGECHILNLCVAGRFARRGYARALLRRLLQMARSLRARSAYLEVRPSNHAAIRLYLELGFRQIGTRRAYYPARHGREDALVLARALHRRDG